MNSEIGYELRITTTREKFFQVSFKIKKFDMYGKTSINDSDLDEFQLKNL